MADRNSEIESHAGALFDELWHRRSEFWVNPPDSQFKMLPTPIVKIATGIVKVRFEVVDRIYDESGGSQTAGLWDPVSRTGQVSRLFHPDVQQFTAGHELGHAVEHQSMTILHRDRGLDGSELSMSRRDPQEREADRFSAALTMPPHLVESAVVTLYGAWLEGNRSIEDLVYSLRAPGGAQIDVSTYLSLDKLGRARWIAKNTRYDGRIVPSLKEIFGVSIEALAIQIERHNLI